MIVQTLSPSRFAEGFPCAACGHEIPPQPADATRVECPVCRQPHICLRPTTAPPGKGAPA